MKTICFCGVDGCGKTTQAKLLFKNLQRAGKNPIYIHILSPKNTVLSRLHEVSVINRAISYIRILKDNFVVKVLKVSLRLFNLLLDSWVTTTMNKVKYKNQAKIMIYDRYFYDILVILAFSYPNILNFIINFSKLIPKPDIVILFEISPEVSVKRKSEHTLDEARRYSEIYKVLGKKINPSFVINAELSEKEIEKNIETNMKSIL